MKPRILCYGDSNTYGYDPRSYLGGRYPASVRWTALLRAAGWPVVPENGSPQAKALARMITTDNDHEPLSAAVEALFGDTYSP